jgi:alpha-galactosidase
MTDMQAVYQKMGDALQKTGRPIVFSLCQYGKSDVWKWGAKVGGNLWRTTGDINDHWQSMDEIGFSQFAIAQYAAARPLERSRHAGNRQRRHDRRRVPHPHEPVVAAGAPLLAGNDLRTMTTRRSQS